MQVFKIIQLSILMILDVKSSDLILLDLSEDQVLSLISRLVNSKKMTQSSLSAEDVIGTDFL